MCLGLPTMRESTTQLDKTYPPAFLGVVASWVVEALLGKALHAECLTLELIDPLQQTFASEKSAVQKALSGQRSNRRAGNRKGDPVSDVCTAKCDPAHALQLFEAAQKSFALVLPRPGASLSLVTCCHAIHNFNNQAEKDMCEHS